MKIFKYLVLSLFSATSVVHCAAATELADDEFYFGAARDYFDDNVKNQFMAGGFVPRNLVPKDKDYDSLMAGSIEQGSAKIGATAFVINNGSSEYFFFITLDTLVIQKVDADEIKSRIRAEIRQLVTDTSVADNARILISTNHTHTSPSTMDLHGVDKNDLSDDKHLTRPNFDFVENMKVTATLAAVNAFKNSIGAKFTIDYVNFEYDPSGKDSSNNDRHGLSVTDKDLSMLVFTGKTEGAKQHILFNYAAHGNISHIRGSIGPQIYGLVARELEAFDGFGVSGFMAGAIGGEYLHFDSNKQGNIPSDGSDPDKKINYSSEVLVDELKQAIKENVLNGDVLTHQYFNFIEREVDYDCRAADEKANKTYINYAFDDDFKILTTFQKNNWPFRQWLREHTNICDESAKTILQEFQIGDLKIYATPGEIFPHYAQVIKEQRGLNSKTIVVSLANDYLGYMPANQYKYEYNSLTSNHSFTAFETPIGFLQAFGFNITDVETKISDTYPVEAVELASYHSWDPRWTHIIPIFNGDNTRILFWQKGSGWGHLYEVDESNGQLTYLTNYQNFGQQWEAVIPLDVTGDGKQSLLFWDKQNGSAELKKIGDSTSGYQIGLPTKTYTNISANIDSIVPLIRQYEETSEGWVIGETSRQDLLFLDNGGEANRYELDDDANLVLKRPISSTEESWDFQNPRDYFNLSSFFEWRWGINDWVKSPTGFFMLQSIIDHDADVIELYSLEGASTPVQGTTPIVLKETIMFWDKANRSAKVYKFIPGDRRPKTETQNSN